MSHTGVHIVSTNTRFGEVRTDGTLGYDSDGITEDKVYLPHVKYESVISAHAPSEVVIRCDEPISLQPALNASACLHAVNSCHFWIDWHCVAELSMPGEVGSPIHLPPGIYRLRSSMDINFGGHSLWLLSASLLPRVGRLAFVTLGCFKHEDLYGQLKWLYRSCAKFGILLHVCGVDQLYQGHYATKIVSIKKWIMELPSQYSSVIYMDGSDTFVLGDESSVLARLTSLGQMCIGAERCSWPEQSHEWTRRFPDVDNRFPQAGMWGGGREYVVNALDRIIQLRQRWSDDKIPELSVFSHLDDDQFLWQAYYLSNPHAISLDIASQCFANMTCSNTNLVVRNKSLHFDKGKIVSNEGNTPLCIHFSGRGRDKLPHWACMLGLNHPRR